MKADFESQALEANLALTIQKQVELPESQRWFVSLSAAYWGINKRTEEFFREYNHPHPDYLYILKELHRISLTDLWLYRSGPESGEALLFWVDIFEQMMSKELKENLQEQLLFTLFKYTEKLVEEDNYPEEAVWRCLALIEKGLAENEAVYLRNSGYFKMYLKKAAGIPKFNQEICRLTKKALRKSLRYWEETVHTEAWFEKKVDLFQPACRDKIRLIGAEFFSDLAERIERSDDWAEIVSNLFFDDLANYFRHFSEQFGLYIEKIHYVFYLLHLPGMAQLKKHLLYDLNRLIKDALSELNGHELNAFTDMMFTLFTELKNQHTGTILDCLFTLGKEIAAVDDHKATAYYMQKLIEFGFVYPGKIKISGDWETKVNPDHVKNIRIWLDLLEISPYKFIKLISALVVNLKLGGIFISDTDLFQRDITRLLNSEIGPVYKQVKQLARLFPVYYHEIGAEGKLRDVSTAMDELSGRRDILIHYVRKQIHAESNNTHIELVKRVATFWYDGELDLLQEILPRDVAQAIDQHGEYFTGISRLTRDVCTHFQVDGEGLLKLSEIEIAGIIQEHQTAEARDKKRLSCLIQLYRLLLEKYSFAVTDVLDLLPKSRFFTGQEIQRLKELLDQERLHQALEQIYLFIGMLKEVILDKTKTEATENIYYKRHIAFGIPSMYGQYREPKFEALGLMYRLEQVASRLIEKMIEGINLEYISAKTLNSIYDLLILFKAGLELDGVVNQNFNSTLEMYRYSLTSSSVTLGQYMNIFRFMAQHIKELISEFFIRVYDETINVVVPQIFDDSPETTTRVAEIFYRDTLASSFLLQELDRFLANLINMIDRMIGNYSAIQIHNMMRYNPDLAVSPLSRETVQMDNQFFLGAKAYYLKKMIAYRFPVPDGFVLTTEVYRHKETIYKHPYMSLELEKMILKHIHDMEISENMKFGCAGRPLLLSVRSGTAISMPGAMSTFLNVGLNDTIAEALGKNPATAWMGWDSYRRFIQSWGMSYGLDRDLFDEVMIRCKQKYGVERKSDFSAEQMREVATEYRKTLNENGVFIVDNPLAQLKQAINNVFDSWSSKRAIAYRTHLQIADEWGTAVVVQKMVMGNRSKRSGSGVVFTRNPKLKTPGINLYGDFTLCSQGEDIVAGLVYTMPISESQCADDDHNRPLTLESAFPRIYQRLREKAVSLIERYGFNHQEIEFTFESDDPRDLYLLQIKEQNIAQTKLSAFSVPAEEMILIGKGIGAGGGCLSGIVSFDMEDLICNKTRLPGAAHILVRPDTVPDDIQMIFLCDGLITSRGGVTSHAAVTAEKLGKVCVVNCKELVVHNRKKQCVINEHLIKTGDTVFIDGQAGNIYRERNNQFAMYSGEVF
ncbi:MAG: hypothetical protein KGZ57_09275 [Dethiobacter sp.]|nr:hypothetical protein [Dethiobacter sp.]